MSITIFLGADVGKDESATGTLFRYPSYVQDIMGDIFSLGFGPFRYVRFQNTVACFPEKLNNYHHIDPEVFLFLSRRTFFFSFQ